jgi:hypothetical protein
VIRARNNRKLTVEGVVLVTSKENLYDTKKAWVSELLGVGMVMSHTMIDKDGEEEREVHAMKKEIESLRHHVEYYKDTNQYVLILKAYFLEGHSRYKLLWDAFVKKIVD